MMFFACHFFLVTNIPVWTYFDRGIICMAEAILNMKYCLPHWYSDKPKPIRPQTQNTHKKCVLQTQLYLCVMCGGWGLDSIFLFCVLEPLPISIKLKQFVELVKWLSKFSDNALIVIWLRYCCLDNCIKGYSTFWTRPCDQKIPIILRALVILWKHWHS